MAEHYAAKWKKDPYNYAEFDYSKPIVSTDDIIRSPKLWKRWLSDTDWRENLQRQYFRHGLQTYPENRWSRKHGDYVKHIKKMWGEGIDTRFTIRKPWNKYYEDQFIKESRQKFRTELHKNAAIEKIKSKKLALLKISRAMKKGKSRYYSGFLRDRRPPRKLNRSILRRYGKRHRETVHLDTLMRGQREFDEQMGDPMVAEDYDVYGNADNAYFDAAQAAYRERQAAAQAVYPMSNPRKRTYEEQYDDIENELQGDVDVNAMFGPGGVFAVGTTPPALTRQMNVAAMQHYEELVAAEAERSYSSNGVFPDIPVHVKRKRHVGGLDRYEYSRSDKRRHSNQHHSRLAVRGHGGHGSKRGYTRSQPQQRDVRHTSSRNMGLGLGPVSRMTGNGSYRSVVDGVKGHWKRHGWKYRAAGKVAAFVGGYAVQRYKGRGAYEKKRKYSQDRPGVIRKKRPPPSPPLSPIVAPPSPPSIVMPVSDLSLANRPIMGPGHVPYVRMSDPLDRYGAMDTRPKWMRNKIKNWKDNAVDYDSDTVDDTPYVNTNTYAQTYGL